MVPIASNSPLDGLSGLDESIYKIKYLIFDYRGNNVETIIQLNTDPDFGSHSLKLAEGDYKIVIWATSGDVRDGSDLKANYDHAVLHAAEYPAGSSPVIIHDSFYKEYDFSVSGTDVSNEIVLERETAKLELQILGGIPSNATTLKLSYTSHTMIRPADYEYGSNASDVNMSEFSSLEQYSDTEGYTFHTYVLPQIANEIFKTDVTLSILDENGNVLTYKVIEDVEVFRNKKTILTGAVGENEESTSSFAINIDTTWDDSHEVVNF